MPEGSGGVPEGSQSPEGSQGGPRGVGKTVSGTGSTLDTFRNEKVIKNEPFWGAFLECLLLILWIVLFL